MTSRPRSEASDVGRLAGLLAAASSLFAMFSEAGGYSPLWPLLAWSSMGFCWITSAAGGLVSVWRRGVSIEAALTPALLGYMAIVFAVSGRLDRAALGSSRELRMILFGACGALVLGVLLLVLVTGGFRIRRTRVVYVATACLAGPVLMADATGRALERTYTGAWEFATLAFWPFVGSILVGYAASEQMRSRMLGESTRSVIATVSIGAGLVTTAMAAIDRLSVLRAPAVDGFHFNVLRWIYVADAGDGRGALQAGYAVAGVLLMTSGALVLQDRGVDMDKSAAESTASSETESAGHG